MHAFVGPRPKRHEIAHYDGNRANNNLSNLRYVTYRENFEDAVRHGRRQQHKQKRLTEAKRNLLFAELKRNHLLVENQITIEIWKPIPGFDGYEASNFGRIRSIDRHIKLRNRWGQYKYRFYRGRVLKPGKNKYGHMHVMLGMNNAKDVHRLVALAFLGPPPKEAEVAHYDGNPANNRLSNLRYDTRRGNSLDRERHGTTHRGEMHYKSILTKNDVRNIRKSKASYRSLASLYGVSRVTISNIRTGRNWGWLT
jgi:hypothetical protein